MINTNMIDPLDLGAFFFFLQCMRFRFFSHRHWEKDIGNFSNNIIQKKGTNLRPCILQPFPRRLDFRNLHMQSLS